MILNHKYFTLNYYLDENNILIIDFNFLKITKTTYILCILFVYIIYFNEYPDIRKILIKNYKFKYIIKYLPKIKFKIIEDNIIKKISYHGYENLQNKENYNLFFEKIYSLIYRKQSCNKPIIHIINPNWTYFSEYCLFHNYYLLELNKYFKTTETNLFPAEENELIKMNFISKIIKLKKIYNCVKNTKNIQL
jgi:hypothetical protein